MEFKGTVRLELGVCGPGCCDSASAVGVGAWSCPIQYLDVEHLLSATVRSKSRVLVRPGKLGVFSDIQGSKTVIVS